jgi:branched-chain amino acid transport system substrate-binding protein
MKKLLLIVLGISLTMGLVLDHTPARAQGKEGIIKIGVCTPLSGPAAPWGIPGYHGVDLAVADLNAAGGIVVKGFTYKFQTVSYDDKCSVDTALQVVNKFIYEDGVKYMVGPVCSPCALAVLPVLTKNKIISMGVSLDDRTIDPAYQYAFRLYIPVSFVGESFFKWIVDNRKIKTSSHISPNDSSGFAATESDNKHLQKLGVQVLDSVFFERATTDFVPFVTKLLAKNPDMITCGGSPAGSVALIAKQARAMGYKGIISNTSIMSATDVVPAVGKEAMEGFISTARPLEPPVAKKMIDLPIREKAKYGETFSSTNEIYAFAEVIAEAIKRAQSLDTTDVKKILEDPRQVWPYNLFENGTLRIGAPRCIEFYGERGKHQAYYPYPITMIKDGKDVILTVVNP